MLYLVWYVVPLYTLIQDSYCEGGHGVGGWVDGWVRFCFFCCSCTIGFCDSVFVKFSVLCCLLPLDYC